VDRKKTLATFESPELTDISTENLRVYQKALQETAGLYSKAYRIYHDRLMKVGKELEARKK